jgi:uncharacterized heparinase superfamily protein
LTLARLRRIADKLVQIGPRPVLLVQYVVHQIRANRRRRRLRRHYIRLIAKSAGSTTTLAVPPLDLPTASHLPDALRASAERLYSEAEQILSHRIELLGSGLIELGDEIDWHRDFKSGYRWESAFYQDVEVVRLWDSSDPKVPWELSRGHHLLTLARAARVFEEDRFAVEIERQFSAWLDQNPTGHGINWTGPMEVAIRAVNWVWTLRTLEPWRPIDADVRRRLNTSLQAHARHISANLEGTPLLRSNHFLAGILGLLVLGVALRDEAEAGRFFETAHRAFEREITRQVHDDGVGFEASLPYHALALEIFLIAHVVATGAGRSFSLEYNERLSKMLAASRALRHSDGRLPQIGDADSGRILPAGFARPATLDHLLWLGATALGGGRPGAGMPHEEVAWTLGFEAWCRTMQLPAGADPESTAFPRGGFFVLRSGGSHLVVRCGDVGQNGNGGHAHNDLLSFELSRGRPVVVDSGTYVYTADPTARNAFRSTAAHNTVVVAGAELNPLPRDELFRLPQFARPRVESWEQSERKIQLTASHDGYRRLKPSVVHRRTFSLDRVSGAVSVDDELLGSGWQEADSFLHFAPDVAPTPLDAGRFELRGPEAEVLFVLTVSGVDTTELTEGWISESYGRRVRAPLLVARVRGQLPLRFGFVLAPIPTHAHSRDTKSFEATA